MNKPIKIILLLVVIALIVWGVVAATDGQQAGEDESIKIGLIAPLTGNAAAFGEEAQAAANIAVEENNEANGINGHHLKLLLGDGKCKGRSAASAGQKLINVSDVRFLFVTCSAETMAVAPIAQKTKTLLISVYGTNPAISKQGSFVFRNAYSDEDTAHAMAETIGEKHKKLGVISEQSSYATGLRDALKKLFDGTIVTAGYPQNSEDVRTAVSKIISENPNAVLVNPDTPKTGLAVLKQLNELGYDGKLYGNFFASSKEVINSPFAQGLVLFADPTVEESKAKERLMNRFKQRTGAIPDFEFPVAATYDSIRLLKKGIESVGTSSPNEVRKYLAEMKNYDGVLGSYHFDKNGDMTGVRPNPKQIKGNEIVPYEE